MQVRCFNRKLGSERNPFFIAERPNYELHHFPIARAGVACWPDCLATGKRAFASH
jgi:hypothetical protein